MFRNITLVLVLVVVIVLVEQHVAETFTMRAATKTFPKEEKGRKNILKNMMRYVFKGVGKFFYVLLFNSSCLRVFFIVRM